MGFCQGEVWSDVASIYRNYNGISDHLVSIDESTLGLMGFERVGFGLIWFVRVGFCPVGFCHGEVCLMEFCQDGVLSWIRFFLEEPWCSFAKIVCSANIDKETIKI